MSTVNTRTTTSSQGRISIPGVGRDIEDVLLWRDPRISGGVFAAGSFLYFLLEWSGMSLLYIFSNTLLALLGLAFLWNTVARFTGRSNASATVGVQRGVNESDVRELSQKLTQLFNKGLAFGNRLISGQDVVLTGEVAVALYVTSKVGKYFSSLGLLYTVFVLGFIIPKIYELRKDDIDSAVSSGYNQSQKGYQQYLKPYVEKIPRASTSARSSGTTSNTTGPTAAGRNAGLTGDSASSGQQFGSGNDTSGRSTQGAGNTGYSGGNSGPSMGEQIQDGAQRFKESAQDFVNPNSQRGGTGTMGERVKEAGQDMTGQNTGSGYQGQNTGSGYGGQGQNTSSGYGGQGQTTGGQGNNFGVSNEGSQAPYHQRTPGGQGYESNERQNLGSTNPGSTNDSRMNTGVGSDNYSGGGGGQGIMDKAANMGRQAYDSAANTVGGGSNTGNTGARY